MNPHVNNMFQSKNNSLFSILQWFVSYLKMAAGSFTFINEFYQYLNWVNVLLLYTVHSLKISDSAKTRFLIQIRSSRGGWRKNSTASLDFLRRNGIGDGQSPSSWIPLKISHMPRAVLRPFRRRREHNGVVFEVGVIIKIEAPTAAELALTVAQ